MGRRHNEPQLDPQPGRHTQIHAEANKKCSSFIQCPLFEFLTLKTASISLSWHKEKSVGQKADMVITVAIMKQVLFTPC